MKPVIFSQREFAQCGIKWTHQGESIQYQEYNKRNSLDDDIRPYYCLSFDYNFKYDNDVVSFAFSEPYTYTDLQADLAIWHINRREMLCETISGLKCDLLTISNFATNGTKKGVILSARVHPGETVGSWIMKGVIQFLLGSDSTAEYLKKHCIFKIVPMLNPDGVVQGNYRCSYSGCDLNRRYTFPSKILHPEVYYMKKMTLCLSRLVPILLYCDFHGHSKKYFHLMLSKDIFMYGNTSEANRDQYKLFPFILSKLSTYFSFSSSK